MKRPNPSVAELLLTQYFMQMFTEILALFVFVLLFVAFLLNAVHLWSQLHFKAEPLQQAESRDTLVLLLFVCVRVCVHTSYPEELYGLFITLCKH